VPNSPKKRKERFMDIGKQSFINTFNDNQIYISTMERNPIYDLCLYNEIS
jgi:hypothetical protein